MKVFISHASTDTKLAKRVANVLRESGSQVVWDDTQILPGDNWGEALANALKESDAMVVLLTPGSLGSPNISYEIGYALGNKNYKGRLIPVISVPPDQLSHDEIPWVLRKFRMIHLADQEGDEEGLRKIAQVLEEAA